MSAQTWNDCLMSNVGVGSDVTTTAITSILPTAALFVLPANILTIGKKYRIRATGTMSSNSFSTLTWDVRFGGVSVFTSQGLSLNSVTKNAVQWQLEIILECLTIGSGTSATMKGSGIFTSEAVVGSPLPSAGSAGSLLMPAGAPVAGTGFSSVTPVTVDLLATNSSSTTRSVICHEYSLENMN